MIVLVADKFETRGLDELREAGCDVIFEPQLASDELRDAISNTQCRVLIVRSTRVTAEMLDAGCTLGLVVRAGAGVNTIDVAAASRRSIFVANCPGKNATAVAELTFALILALDRRVVENVLDLRNRIWNKTEYAKARGLKGRTLGILGMGPIGQAVARRALAFGMPVAAWSRSLTDRRAEKWGIQRCADPAAVASCCDVLTVHLAAAPETQGLVNEELLARLEPGSYLINTARAEIVDYHALAKAVTDRGLRVGLDVFPHEPSSGTAEFLDPIVKAGGIVYGTHHIGASTNQAQDAIAQEAVAIVREYFRSGRVRNCVNLCDEPRGRYILSIRHRNRPGVLAHTLNAVSHAGVNVEHMENVICQGGEAACAHITLDGPLNEALLTSIDEGNEHVFAISFGPLLER